MTNSNKECPNCTVGMLKEFTIVTYGSPAADTMVEMRETGERCGSCGYEQGFELLGPGNRTVAARFGARCDFCGEEDPVIVFPCRDFTTDDGELLQGGWAACPACRDMVDADDHEGLISRAIYLFAKQHPRTCYRLLARGVVPGRPARRRHQGFWLNRITATEDAKSQ